MYGVLEIMRNFSRGIFINDILQTIVLVSQHLPINQSFNALGHI